MEKIVAVALFGVFIVLVVVHMVTSGSRRQ